MKPIEFWVVPAMSGVVLILFIWILVLTLKYGRLKNTVMKMMGDSGVPRLDEVMDRLHSALKQMEQRQQTGEEAVARLERALQKMKGNIGVYRYNAFAETGSDLSFSVAFLDNEQDGVVISGIYNRDNTYMYAKPLKTGESKYTLTQEEKHAINLALQRE